MRWGVIGRPEIPWSQLSLHQQHRNCSPKHKRRGKSLEERNRRDRKERGRDDRGRDLVLKGNSCNGMIAGGRVVRKWGCDNWPLSVNYEGCNENYEAVLQVLRLKGLPTTCVSVLQVLDSWNESNWSCSDSPSLEAVQINSNCYVKNLSAGEPCPSLGIYSPFILFWLIFLSW